MIKSIALVVLATGISSSAFADTILNVEKNKEFRLYKLPVNGRHLYMACDLIDRNGDGAEDAVQVTLSLDSIFGNEPATLLQANTISQVFDDESNVKICGAVDAIHDETRMGFGTLEGKVASVLKIENGQLVEDLVVTVGRLEPADSTKLTLKARIVKPLNAIK
ncbi:MAG TPA: hypothetical protein VM432_07310 [Bdellovibrionales bacterium]|jgi:hypothetical protein|nr:hypothetical protein [Bdellovibrionales bacterium]